MIDIGEISKNLPNDLGVIVRDLPNKFEIDDYLYLFSDEATRIFYYSKNKNTLDAKRKIIRHVQKEFYDKVPHSIQLNKIYFDFLRKMDRTEIKFI